MASEHHHVWSLGGGIAAALHLRNVVVVNPGHEPWGESFYKCDACSQCAFGISIYFYNHFVPTWHMCMVENGVHGTVENGSLYLH